MDKKLITAPEVAENLDISTHRLYALISQERVVGAHQVGAKRKVWLIPVDKEGKPEILPPPKRARSFSKIKTAPKE